MVLPDLSSFAFDIHRSDRPSASGHVCGRTATACVGTQELLAPAGLSFALPQ
jgi:hypothetical protein